MNTHTIMIIEPMQKGFKYSIIKKGNSLSSKDLFTLEELATVRDSIDIDEVFIDQGFRTDDARKAAEKYGWTLTRGL